MLTSDENIVNVEFVLQYRIIDLAKYLFKVDDVTLKRGLVGSDDLFAWLKTVRDGTADVRQVTITLLDEARRGESLAPWKAEDPMLQAELLLHQPGLAGSREEAGTEPLAAAPRATALNRC